MKITCETEHCKGKAQGTCFQCEKIYCFKCSIEHAKQYGEPHQLLELEQSLKRIADQLNCSQRKCVPLKLIRQCSTPRRFPAATAFNRLAFKINSTKLTSQKRRLQKSYRNSFQKQVQSWYIWEVYLKEFTVSEDLQNSIKNLQEQLQTYAQTKLSEHDLVKKFFKSNYPKQISLYKAQMNEIERKQKVVPFCPEIHISDRVLVEISEMLCHAISTSDFALQKRTGPQSFQISIGNYLVGGIKEVPIFPIKKPYCYILNLESRDYQIQELKKLETLPDYPKSVVIPNGDIHLIGGVRGDEVVDTHLVFRTSSAEVFALNSLPYCINPSNSLLYHNKHIYLIGGLGSAHDWIARCSKYSLQFKQWREITPMKSNKPHQTAFTFQDCIYCFGIPNQQKMNIEKYIITSDKWEDIIITNFMSNPFNFASGFLAAQVNSSEVLFIGGKKFLEDTGSQERTTERCISPYSYLFCPLNNSFRQLDCLNVNTGVHYGESNPIVYSNTLYYWEFLISKNYPVVRWYDALQVMSLKPKNNSQMSLESIVILNEQ